jgi:hypothetical protein
MTDLAKQLVVFLASIAIGCSAAMADCVSGAQSKTRFQTLDSETILLTGGYGGRIVIKIFCCAYASSNLTILKDDFCSFDSSVLYLDGEVVDVRDVKKID